MSRITIPPVDQAPAASKALLDGVKKEIGSVPNLFRVLGNSPTALAGYLGLSAAVGKGALDAKLRERLALAVAQINGCHYCLSAHTYLGKNVAKLDDAEIAAARDSHSADPKAAAALRFAQRVTELRGNVSDADLEAVKRAGYSEGEVLEIVANVAVSVLTNYVNNVSDTDIDFPKVSLQG
jgi:uncharacterized peroxidase-related enzyme